MRVYPFPCSTKRCETRVVAVDLLESLRNDAVEVSER